MSTYLYLECLDHDPPLRADDESGQHHYDLPRIRQMIADRDALLKHWDTEWTNTWSFTTNTMRFLAQHRTCRIGIIDEYGERHPLQVQP